MTPRIRPSCRSLLWLLITPATYHYHYVHIFNVMTISKASTSFKHIRLCLRDLFIHFSSSGCIPFGNFRFSNDSETEICVLKLSLLFHLFSWLSCWLSKILNYLEIEIEKCFSKQCSTCSIRCLLQRNVSNWNLYPNIIFNVIFTSFYSHIIFHY